MWILSTKCPSIQLFSVCLFFFTYREFFFSVFFYDYGTFSRLFAFSNFSSFLTVFICSVFLISKTFFLNNQIILDQRYRRDKTDYKRQQKLDFFCPSFALFFAFFTKVFFPLSYSVDISNIIGFNFLLSYNSFFFVGQFLPFLLQRSDSSFFFPFFAPFFPNRFVSFSPFYRTFFGPVFRCFFLSVIFLPTYNSFWGIRIFKKITLFYRRMVLSIFFFFAFFIGQIFLPICFVGLFAVFAWFFPHFLVWKHLFRFFLNFLIGLFFFLAVFNGDGIVILQIPIPQVVVNLADHHTMSYRKLT